MFAVRRERAFSLIELVMTIMIVGASNLVYRIQTALFPMPRETFTVVIYGFLGMYKLGVIFLNFTPWMALLIIG